MRNPASLKGIDKMIDDNYIGRELVIRFYFDPLAEVVGEENIIDQLRREFNVLMNKFEAAKLPFDNADPSLVAHGHFIEQGETVGRWNFDCPDVDNIECD